MLPQVVVVGSFVQDLTFSCDHFPAPGETTVGLFKTGPGGKGSNQAIAAGRAGAKTLYIGAVGKDAFAQGAKAFYKTEGIGAEFAEKPRHATGTAAILVNKTGQNEIVVALGANAVISKSDINMKALRGARIVVSQLESNLETAAFVLRSARNVGVTTVLNPAPMRPDFDPTMLAHVDILIPNETEFTTLVNALPSLGRTEFTEKELHQLDPENLHQLCRKFDVPVLIVTLGSKGCFVSQKNSHTFIPAYTGISVVDTTGAGDAFVGGFAAGFVKSDGDIVAAANYGNAVAALSVTRFGTAPSMPKLNEINRFVKRQVPRV